MGLFAIALAFIVLALWQRSNFLQIISGMVCIGWGAYWINLGAAISFMYIIEGVAVIGMGLYFLIMAAISLLGRE